MPDGSALNFTYNRGVLLSGVKKYKNGFYEGELNKNSKAHGHGVKTYFSGYGTNRKFKYSLEGKWENGKPIGPMTRKNADGSVEEHICDLEKFSSDQSGKDVEDSEEQDTILEDVIH